MTTSDTMLISLTAEIVSAHVAHNTVAVSDLPTLITNVHTALTGLGVEAVAAAPQQPAVPVRASVKADYIVCLEDGKRMKMLKRHLLTDHQMTPDSYRTKWQLPADYPMVAPTYATARRTLALGFGLGKRRISAADNGVEVPDEPLPPAFAAEPPAPNPRTRKPRLKIAV